MSEDPTKALEEQGPFIRTVIDDSVRYFSILDVLLLYSLATTPLLNPVRP